MTCKPYFNTYSESSDVLSVLLSISTLESLSGASFASDFVSTSNFNGFNYFADFYFVSESGSSTPASPRVKITSCSG